MNGLRLSMLWAIVPIATITLGAVPTPHSRTLWEPMPIAPGLNEFPGLPKANGSEEILASLRLANIDISLDHTPFSDIQAGLGGFVDSKGEAGNNVRWLCYYGKASPRPWMIWLEGNELYQTSVASFQWRTLGAHEVADPRCPALPDASAVSLPVSISLGQSRPEVRAALGPPTTEYASVWLYVHSHMEINRGIPFSVLNSVTILFRGDTVEAIEAGRSSTD